MTFGDEPVVAAPAEVTGYEIERDLAAAGARCVAGVDEVGRGAWAGPVTVCAVITGCHGRISTTCRSGVT